MISAGRRYIGGGIAKSAGGKARGKLDLGVSDMAEAVCCSYALKGADRQASWLEMLHAPFLG